MNKEPVNLKMKEDVHLAELGDICFYKGKLLSVADDGILNIFKIQSNASVNQPDLELESQIELAEHQGETHSISTNQVNKIALAGSTKTVDIFTLVDQDGESDNNVFSKGAALFGKENSFAAMKFNSKVKKVRYSGNKWVLGFSEDECVTVFNTESELTFSCSPGHSGCCALSAAVDPTGQFIATAGSDGYLNIYKISHSKATFQQKIQICSTKVPVDRTFDLDMHWIDGETIIVPGAQQLGCIQMQDTEGAQWELCLNEAIYHSKEMSSLFAISDQILVTHSQEDRVLRVWEIGDEGAECLQELNVQNPVISMLYDNRTKCLAIMDKECKIGVFKRDFSGQVPEVNAEAQVAEVEDQQEVLADDQEIQDALDSDNFEMNDLQDIDLDDDNEPSQNQNLPNNKHPTLQQQSEKAVQEINHPVKQAIKEAENKVKISEEPVASGKEIISQESKHSKQEEVEHQKAREYRQRKMSINQQMNGYIDVDPQPTFVPNCKFVETDKAIQDTCILAWNVVGTVTLRRQLQFTSIDVDFTDKNFHRNLSINDDFSCCMASLNYSGLMIASKAEQQDLDAYEDDEEHQSIKPSQEEFLKVDKKCSYLYYKPLNEWKNLKDWHYKLREDESIECIAQGTSWCACYTDKGYIRIFSQDGVQKYVLHQSSMVVSMVGYENMLVVVYHSGLPVYEHQQMKYQIIDCGLGQYTSALGLAGQKQYSVLFEGSFPTSKDNYIKWLGFSEEGMLATLSQNGVLSGLNFKNNQWVPMLDLVDTFPLTFENFWVVGLMENELLAIEMPSNCDSPPLSMKNVYKRIDLQIPLLKQDTVEGAQMQQLQQKDELFIRNSLIIDHEQYRKDVWEPLKHYRSRYDSERALTENIMEAADVTNKKRELDKLVIENIRVCIMNEDHQKVFTYMNLLHYSVSLKLVVKLCDQLKQVALAQQVSKFLADKQYRESFELDRLKHAAPPTQTFDSRQMSACLQPSKTNQNAEMETDTNPLARFAVKNTGASLPESQATSNNNGPQCEQVEQAGAKFGIQNGTRNISQAQTQAPKPAKANPFQKQGTTDEKMLVQKGGNKDIFNDLGADKKRKNPFAAANGSGVSNAGKQRKIK